MTKCWQGTEEGGDFLPKAGGAIHRKSGNSSCHFLAFTTWSHHLLIIESIPALELGISSQKFLQRRTRIPLLETAMLVFAEKEAAMA